MSTLIAIEGIDGIGKATTVNYLRKFYEEQNKRCITITFPSYDRGKWSSMITQYLRHAAKKPHHLERMILAMSYAYDRYTYGQKIHQALQQYDLVILDRFVASNMVYQAAHYDNPDTQKQCQDFIYYMEHYRLKLPVPDLYFLLNGDTTLAKQNLDQTKKELDYHERNLSYLQRVQQQYIKLARTSDSCNRPVWVIIDVKSQTSNVAQKSPEDIIKQIVSSKLKSLMQTKH